MVLKGKRPQTMRTVRLNAALNSIEFCFTSLVSIASQRVQLGNAIGHGHCIHNTWAFYDIRSVNACIGLLTNDSEQRLLLFQTIIKCQVKQQQFSSV